MSFIPNFYLVYPTIIFITGIIAIFCIKRLYLIRSTEYYLSKGEKHPDIKFNFDINNAIQYLTIICAVIFIITYFGEFQLQSEKLAKENKKIEIQMHKDKDSLKKELEIELRDNLRKEIIQELSH